MPGTRTTPSNDNTPKSLDKLCGLLTLPEYFKFGSILPCNSPRKYLSILHGRFGHLITQPQVTFGLISRVAFKHVHTDIHAALEKNVILILRKILLFAISRNLPNLFSKGPCLDFVCFRGKDQLRVDIYSVARFGWSVEKFIDDSNGLSCSRNR